MRVGEHDIIIKVGVTSMEELNQLINTKIRSIDGVEDLTEMIVMEGIKGDISSL